jgi:hypothetical protein
MKYRAVWTAKDGTIITTGWTDKKTAFFLLRDHEGYVENEKGEKVQPCH